MLNRQVCCILGGSGAGERVDSNKQKGSARPEIVLRSFLGVVGSLGIILAGRRGPSAWRDLK